MIAAPTMVGQWPATYRVFVRSTTEATTLTYEYPVYVECGGYYANEGLPVDSIIIESPRMAKLRRAFERTRAAVEDFVALVRRLPLRAQRVASRVVEPEPAQLVGLKRWKRRTCGEHNRYRVMVA